jgi:hypothetical protein
VDQARNANFFFVLVAAIATSGALAERGFRLPFIEGASLHAICPFGAFQGVFNLFRLGAAFRVAPDRSAPYAGRRDLYARGLSPAEVEKAAGFKPGAEKDVVRDEASAAFRHRPAPQKMLSLR